MESVAAAVSSLRDLAGAEPLATLAARFASAGHELALVGGPVRDAFLGRPVNDLDLTTSATTPLTSIVLASGRSAGAGVHGFGEQFTDFDLDGRLVPIVVRASEPRLPVTVSVTMAAAPPGLVTMVAQRAKLSSVGT